MGTEGFETATDNYLESLGEQSSPELDESAEQSEDPNSETPVEQSAIELDKIEKFKFKGKDYTVKDLERFESIQPEFTKKSQELAEERKYSLNAPADLAKVRANPALAEQFKSIYPKHYHAYVDLIKAKAEGKEQTEKQSMDPKFMEEFNGMRSELQEWKQAQHEAQVSAKQQELASLADEMTKKYPSSDEEVVLARVQNLVDGGKIATSKDQADAMGIPLLNKELWEKFYKDVHDKFESRTIAKQKEKFNTVKSANLKGSSAGRGGSPPSAAPKKVRSIGEATDMWVEDLGK